VTEFQLSLLAKGKISGLAMLNYGITTEDLRKRGWVQGPINEDAWYVSGRDALPTMESTARDLVSEMQWQQAMARVAELEAEIESLKTAAAITDVLYADRPGTLFSARKKIETELRLEREAHAHTAALASRLIAENNALKQLANASFKFGPVNVGSISTSGATTTFGDPAPADMPARARRPDGTLAPQPKPFPVMKQANDRRLIGG
jgi:hypothetical protein